MFSLCLVFCDVAWQQTILSSWVSLKDQVDRSNSETLGDLGFEVKMAVAMCFFKVFFWERVVFFVFSPFF